MTAEVHVITHPLVQHKLTLLRRKDLSTSSFRRLMHEISMLMAYEVTRDMPTQLIEIETPLEAMQSPVIDGKKTVFVVIMRAGSGFLDGMLRGGAGCARGPRGPVPRPQDAGGGGVLLQDAARHARARRHRARPHAGHRQFGSGGGGPAEGDAAEARSAWCACWPRPKACAISTPTTPTCPCTPPPSTASSTSTATSCRGWEMPGTGCSAPSSARRRPSRRHDRKLSAGRRGRASPAPAGSGSPALPSLPRRRRRSCS